MSTICGFLRLWFPVGRDIIPFRDFPQEVENMRILIAALCSFVLSAVAGKFLIPVLRRMKAGQSIK